jgi:hypothetical protein
MGQQVERLQVAQVADQRDEAAIIGVGQVFLLGDLRHDQVVFDQPDDQFGVFLAQAVVDAEFAGVGAQLGMVAAAALGDVVEEGGDIEQPGAFEFAGDARAQGFVGKRSS